MPRIAILGGGLCGRLTALQLAEQGLSIALFDKGGRKGEHAAAYVAAAMLAPVAEAVEATPEVIKLGRQSIPLWRDIRGRLKTPTMMQENGSLIVWHGQDKPLSSEFVRHLKRGGVADDEIIRWRADDIAKREPQLGGRFSDGIYLPTEGQLDGRQMLSALADALDGLNVPCHWEHECVPEDLQAQYDWLIDCRGYGAKTAWNQSPAHQHLARHTRRSGAGLYTRNHAQPPRAPAPSALPALHRPERKPRLHYRRDPNRKRKPSSRQRTFRTGTLVRALCCPPRLRRSRHPRNRHRPAPHAQPPQPRNPLQPRPTPD